MILPPQPQPSTLQCPETPSLNSGFLDITDLVRAFGAAREAAQAAGHTDAEILEAATPADEDDDKTASNN